MAVRVPGVLAEDDQLQPLRFAPPAFVSSPTASASSAAHASILKRPGRPSRNVNNLGQRRRVGSVTAFSIGDSLPAGRDMADVLATRIQRQWRLYVTRRRRVQNYYASKIQSHWRGFVARRDLESFYEGRGHGERVLWWVTAHQQMGPTGRKDRVLPRGPKDREEMRQQKKILQKHSAALLRWVDSAKAKAAKRRHAAGSDADAKGEGNPEDKAKALLEKKRRQKKRGSKRGLPRWFVYIAYGGCFAFCALCSYFILLYGLKFDPAVSRAWILSSIFALFVEFFVQDPAMILGMSVLSIYLQEQYNAYKAKQEAQQEAARRARTKASGSRIS